jgi:hypothetical protein
VRKAKLLAEHESLAHRDHRDAEDHVVADLRRLAVAGFAAMHHPLAHALDQEIDRCEVRAPQLGLPVQRHRTL